MAPEISHSVLNNDAAADPRKSSSKVNPTDSGSKVNPTDSGYDSTSSSQGSQHDPVSAVNPTDSDYDSTSSSPGSHHDPVSVVVEEMDTEDDFVQGRGTPIVTFPTHLQSPNLPSNFQEPLILKFAMHRYFTFPPTMALQVEKLDLANSGFYLTADQAGVQCYFCKAKLCEAFNMACNVDAKHRELSPTCPLMRNEDNLDDIPITDPTNYRYEAHRLYSLLITQWTAPVTQYDLAKFGFYWTGSGDNCRCAFCRLEVRGWEPSDTAASEHRRWNPNCVFMNNRSVGNVPIGRELSGTPLVNDDAGIVAPVSTYSVNPFARSEIHSYGQIKYMSGARKLPIEVLGVTPVNPARHADHITLAKRIDSYKMWPKCLPQKPRDLAEAGFYYTGTGDRVICFQCGGGLKDWAETDTPWAEHAKWFSKCPYLLLKKGKIFVDETLKDQKIEMPIQPAIEAYQLSLKMLDEDREKANVAEQKKLEGRFPPVPAGSLRCKLCYVKDVETVYLPCGHVVACMDCVEKESNCRRCNTPRVAYVRTFLQ